MEGPVNQIPGTASPEQLLCGDGPADIMDNAIIAIAKEFQDAWGRGPRQEELRAILNFCSNPDEFYDRRGYWKRHK